MIWLLMSISTLLLGSASGLILKETQILPRNEKEYIAFTKDIQCPNETFPHYVPSSTLFKTYITCWIKRIVFGCCLEYNEGGKKVQLSYGRNCTGYPLSPCKPFYNSTDSYKIFECFEKYGGILSPKQQLTKMLQYCQAHLQQTKNISEELEECTISQQNTELELNKTLKAEKLEAKKYQDCKEDLKVTEIVLGVLVPVVALVTFFAGYGLKKLRTKRRKNSDGNSLGRGNIDKCKGKKWSESGVKTEKEDDENIKEYEMENLMNKSELNDCGAVSKAVPVSEEDNAYTVEKGKTSEFFNLDKRSPLRTKDIDRAFAKQ